ncbi:MAG: hypothetical protein AAFU80_19310 [Pseudomonadota bacterium]
MKPDGNRNLGRIGLAFTTLYLCSLAAVIWHLGLGSTFSELSLNTFGDFLAGAFGPLAIFWVVLGFFQQGAELRNSVEALRIQTEELRASVAQQRELSISAKRQLELQEASIERQHELERRYSSSEISLSIDTAQVIDGEFRMTIWIKNNGADAESVKFSIAEPQLSIPEIEVFDLKHGGRSLVSVKTGGPSFDLEKSIYQVSSISVDQVGRTRVFEFSSNRFALISDEIEETHDF